MMQMKRKYVLQTRARQKKNKKNRYSEKIFVLHQLSQRYNFILYLISSVVRIRVFKLLFATFVLFSNERKRQKEVNFLIVL